MVGDAYNLRLADIHMVLMLSRQNIVLPHQLIKQARALPPLRVGIVASNNEIAINTARLGVELGLIEPILIGNPKRIDEITEVLGWRDYAAVYAAQTEIEAAARGAELAQEGVVNALMKGDLHTDEYIRPILSRKYGLRSRDFVSHIFVLSFPDEDRFLFITDAAVNIAPPLIKKQKIVENAVKLAQRLGHAQPRVVLLSASEDVREQMPSTIDAQSVTKWAEEHFGDEALVYGPLALDMALSHAAAAIKRFEHPICGQADILVADAIESGNVLYKSLVYFRSACAAGLVLGCRIPVILTSRADSEAARIASVAIANIAHQAAAIKQSTKD